MYVETSHAELLVVRLHYVFTRVDHYRSASACVVLLSLTTYLDAYRRTYWTYSDSVKLTYKKVGKLCVLTYCIMHGT